MDENFYTGYRSNTVEPDEILVNITIPFTTESQFFHAFKQARRREDDISIVTGAFLFDVDLQSKMIRDACVAFGGMGPRTLLAQDLRKNLKGREWNLSLIHI